MRCQRNIREFIEANVKGRSTEELTNLVNETFGEHFTTQQIRNYKRNHKLRSGVRGNQGKSRLFSDEIRQFITEQAKGRTTVELTRLVNETFNKDYAPKQLRAYKQNHKISSGVDCKYKKGEIRADQEHFRKGHPPTRSVFKKGHVPHNQLPVGTEVVTVDGYHRTKIADPDVWKFTHVLNYEKQYGPVKQNQMVIFKDKNKDNLNIDNLVAVEKSVSFEMNRNSLRSSFPEVTEAGVALANLNIAFRKKRGE